MTTKRFKHGNPKMYNHFSEKVWDRMTEPEREMWHSEPDPEFEQEDVPTKDKLQRELNDRTAKKMTEGLRLKPGQVYNFAAGKITILAWGSSAHLIEVESNRGSRKFGTMPRKVKDSSWGMQDQMDFYPTYSTYQNRNHARKPIKLPTPE